MARILKSSTVRRRLFDADDVTDQAKNDNLTNLLQESIAMDRLDKMKKWNFDFENEVPLDGTYEWYPCNTSRFAWIGAKSEKNCKEEDSCLPKKLENEFTPTVKEQKERTAKVLKKRKSNTEVDAGKGIRRKITFD